MSPTIRPRNSSRRLSSIAGLDTARPSFSGSGATRQGRSSHTLQYPQARSTEPSEELPNMSEVQSGLEGVVAFATEIAEPDKAGGALRYRGVDIEDLVGQVRFENVWGLLVDGTFEPGLPPRRAAPAGDPLQRPARGRAGRARDARPRMGPPG